MSFLERLDAGTRARFEAFGSEVSLEAGAYLLRRGDAAGDLYLLRSGTLEVIDTLTGAAALLAVLEAGTVVGEVSFLDDAPRTADVRARAPCRLLKWAREDVRALGEREPVVAARLYEEMARTLAARVRSLSDQGPARGVAWGGLALADVEPDLAAEAAALVERAKTGLERADEELRARPYDPASVQGVRNVMDRLDLDLRGLFASRPPPEVSRELARRLRRELRPWLARSALAERCLRERADQVVGVEVIAQVLADVARGEGLIGSHIDRWLLDRPSLQGRRHADAVHLAALAAHVGPGQARAMLLDALVPERLRAIADHIAPHDGELVLVDPSVEALAAAEAQLGAHDPAVRVRSVREGVVRLALGRVEADVGRVDVALAFNLLVYLPDRIATSVLRWAAERLAPDGVVLAGVLDEGEDEALLAHLLGWPSVRRAPARVERLAASAGMRLVRTVPVEGPVTLVELAVRRP